LGATIVGMFTKEITVTIPFMLALYECSFFGPWRDNGKKRLLSLAPFSLTLPIIPITLKKATSVIMEIAHKDSSYPMSQLEYYLTQLNVIRTYLRLLFVPVNQNLHYDYPISRHFLEPTTFFSFILLVGIGLFASRLLRRRNSSSLA